MTPQDLGALLAPLPAQASVLVVGAGLAGLRTVALLRQHGHAGAVHLVGAEPDGPYDRPPLSKHLLDDAMRVDLGADLGIDLDAIGVEVRLGTRVAQLATVKEGRGTRYRATLSPGAGDGTTADAASELVVDAVVLATGAGALRVPGWEHALTLHTLADAERLRSALTAHERPRLVCIGAGWIGSEVAGVAAAAGAHVTVVERAEHPLDGALGSVGAHTAAWFASAGVTLLTGAGVAAVEHDGIVLDDGRRVPADVVLSSVGARPAPLPSGDVTAGLVRAPDGSVRVDSAMRPYLASDDGAGPEREDAGVSSHPWLRVVGDAALRDSARHGTTAGGHWDAALTGPEAAVRSLLDPATNDIPDPAPYVFSTMLGHDLAMYGVPGAHDEVVLRGDPAGTDGWAALWFARPRAAAAPAGDALRDGEPAAGPQSNSLLNDDAPSDDSLAADAPNDEAPAADAPNVEALRTLTAVFVVDRPRDVAAARRLFRGAALPRLVPSTASDPAVPLTAR